MKLSIIMISYNEAEFLPKAIESCLEQEDFPHDFELIIADDGSSDHSEKVIRSYVEKYPEKIKYFVQERRFDGVGLSVPSIRVSNSIKRAVSMAEGEYFVILSGDDYFCDKYKFAKQVGFLDEHPKYMSVMTGFRAFYESGEADKDFLPKHACRKRSLFWSGMYIHISSFIFRRTVFDGGYLTRFFCDDTALIYSIACAGPWKCMDDITFAYRQRSSSIMHSADELQLSLIELLLWEDCAEKKKFGMSSLARFAKPLKYCFRHRGELGEEKYAKYIEISREGTMKLADKLLHYNELSLFARLGIRMRCVGAGIARFVMRVRRKVGI